MNLMQRICNKRTVDCQLSTKLTIVIQIAIQFNNAPILCDWIVNVFIA